MKFILEYTYSDNGQEFHRGCFCIEHDSEEELRKEFKEACERAESEIEFLNKNIKHLNPQSGTVGAQNQAKRNRVSFLETIGKSEWNDIGVMVFQNFKIHRNDIVGFFRADDWFAFKMKEQGM